MKKTKVSLRLLSDYSSWLVVVVIPASDTTYRALKWSHNSKLIVGKLAGPIDVIKPPMILEEWASI